MDDAPNTQAEVLNAMSHHFRAVIPSFPQNHVRVSTARAAGAKSRQAHREKSRALATATSSRLYYERFEKHLDNQSFDADYLQRLAEGDPSVEAHFTAYFGRLLMLKLRSRFRAAHSIDDIRQETFLRVLQHLRQKGGLEHPERLGAFVNSVCNNVIFEMFRSHSRYTALDDAEAEPVDRVIDLDGALVNEERKRLVEKVLSQLSKTDQEILKMLFFDETDKDEICRSMGVDRDYLRVLVYRARLRFKTALEKLEVAVP